MQLSDSCIRTLFYTPTPYAGVTQMANVGFQDVTQETVRASISRNTLFIHGRASGGGSAANTGVDVEREKRLAAITDCTSACGLPDQHGIQDSMSTFCDPSCSPTWSSVGARFGGHNCGANDAPRFGNSCRLCHTNNDVAITEEQRLGSSMATPSTSAAHVVMCSTSRPPHAPECSEECKRTVDTASFRFKVYD